MSPGLWYLVAVGALLLGLTWVFETARGRRPGQPPRAVKLVDDHVRGAGVLLELVTALPRTLAVTPSRPRHGHRRVRPR